MAANLLQPYSAHSVHNACDLPRTNVNPRSSDALEDPQVDQKMIKPTTLIDLPRELRDKIYGLLLIKKLDVETYAKYKAHLNGNIGTAARKRQRAIHDARRQMGISISDSRTLGDVKMGLGLLLVNKQIREESRNFLFKENTFYIELYTYDYGVFWDVTKKDEPPSPSCPFMTPEDLARIETLRIDVLFTCAIESEQFQWSIKVLEANVSALVELILESGLKLKMMQVTYMSGWLGQIEDARRVFEHPSTGPPIRVHLFDPGSPYCWRSQTEHCFSRDNLDLVFGHTRRILNSLKLLKGLVEDPDIRGDLRGSYIDELTSAINGGKPSARTMLRTQAEEKAENMRQSKHKPYNYVKVARAMAVDEGNHQARLLCELWENGDHISDRLWEEVLQLGCTCTHEDCGAYEDMQDHDADVDGEVVTADGGEVSSGSDSEEDIGLAEEDGEDNESEDLDAGNKDSDDGFPVEKEVSSGN